MPVSEHSVVQSACLNHIGCRIPLRHGINFHHYRIFGLVARLVHFAAKGLFFTVSAWLLVLHIAKIMAASDILASAGAIVTVSVEVVIMTAFIAFLEAIAILSAEVTACISALGKILGTTAWAVFIDLTRLPALVADPVTVVGVATLVAMLKHDAFEAARIKAHVNGAVYIPFMAAFLVLANFRAKLGSMDLIMVVMGTTFFSIPFIDKDHLLRGVSWKSSLGNSDADNQGHRSQ